MTGCTELGGMKWIASHCQAASHKDNSSGKRPNILSIIPFPPHKGKETGQESGRESGPKTG